MRNQIDTTRQKLENRPETDDVTLDGSVEEIFIRVMCDGDIDDEFRDYVEEELGLDIRSMTRVPFGTEVVVA